MAGGRAQTPNPHKALGVKRKYLPRPRGAAFFLTPFLRGHGSGGEGTASATRLAIGGRRDSWPGRPRTSRTQHSYGLRRPDPAGPGGCAGEQAPAGPDTHSCPGPWPFKERRAHLPQGRGQLGTAHGWGGSSGDGLLPRGCGPAGVGRTWDGASAPSPYSVRQPRADLVSSPDPPPGRGPMTDHRGQRGRRARPASHQSVGLPGLRPRTPGAGSWPSDSWVSSLRLAPSAPVRPRLAGRPAAQCLTKRLTSKTSLVCSMW